MFVVLRLGCSNIKLRLSEDFFDEEPKLRLSKKNGTENMVFTIIETSQSPMKDKFRCSRAMSNAHFPSASRAYI